jgi:4-amino-4-deoxy-L-arabinose transferase-like glycosyltransferase
MQAGTETATDTPAEAPLPPVLRRCLLLVLALFCLCGVFDHGLWGPNDSREGAMVWEMEQAGRWVTPTIGGVPYLEKPPLLHWTARILRTVLPGRGGEGGLRLPAALFGFAAALTAVWFGRRLGRERAGWMAAFMCVTAAQYMEYSRVVLTDTCVAACAGASLVLFWRTWTRPGRRAIHWIPFLLAASATFYAKGFVGPALVWAGCGLFLLWKRQWKLVFALPLAYLLLQALFVLPWALALWRDGGEPLLRSALWDNQFGRFFVFGSPEDHPELPFDPYFVHKEDVFFYLRMLPGMWLPWTLPAIGGIVHACRRRGAPGLAGGTGAFLRFALGGQLLLLHLSSAKVANYMLPAYPLFMLFAAVWIGDTLPAARPKSLVRIACAATSWMCAVAALALPLASAVGLFYRHEGLVAAAALGPVRTAWCLALAIGLAAYSVWCIRRFRLLWKTEAGPLHAMRLLPVAFAAALVLGISAGFPPYDAHRSPAAFGQRLRRELDSGRRIWLGPMAEKHVGACIYYAREVMPSLDLDAASRDTLLRASADTPVAIVMTRSMWEKQAVPAGWSPAFAPLPDDAPASVPPNYASARFLLVAPD